MTQPPSPSAAARKIANGYLEVSYEWRQKLAEEIDAFAAQAVAAERERLAGQLERGEFGHSWVKHQDEKYRREGNLTAIAAAIRNQTLT